MSVIRIPKAETEPRLQSGGAMDKVVEVKGLSKQVKIAIVVALVLVAALVFYFMAPSASSQTVAADRVTVSTVE